jgi:hypothetical protein
MGVEEVGWKGMSLNHLVLDIDKWQALVNAIMSSEVSENAGNFLNS